MICAPSWQFFDRVKDDGIMLIRLFSIAIVFTAVATTQAQLPSQNRVSPINYFGRYHGFGYSDGYHECKESKVRPASFWKPWESMSSFYGQPTVPPSGSIVGSRTSVGSNVSLFPSQHDYSNGHSYGSIPSVRQHATPLPGTLNAPSPTYAPMNVQPNPTPASPPLPYVTSLDT